MRFPKPARLRLASQLLFLAAFLLLINTERCGLTKSRHSFLLHHSNFFFTIDPLAALSDALASRSLHHGLILSLIVILPTLLFGRVFCGWVCPMGTLNHFFGWLRSESKLGKRRLESNRYKKWQTTKYYILAGGSAAALFGSGLIGWFDPFSLLTRSFGLSLAPSFNYALSGVFKAMEESPVRAVSAVGGFLHWILGAALLDLHQPYFRQGFFLGLIFLLALAANLRVTRFWCRALCPLGGLLGLLSRWSLFNLNKDEAKCTKCQRCLLDCQGGDDPAPGAKWRKAECHMCMNCVASCPEQSLKFELLTIAPAVEAGPNLQKRKTLTALAVGAAAIPMLRASKSFASGPDPSLLRPPGALAESEFLARCIRCGQCMKACPNNALHPALTEGGLEALWTPVLTPRIGFCGVSCTRCSHECPTGAIWPISPAQKGWDSGRTQDNKPVKLGTSFYDKGRCLPWASGIDCAVCEEWCPTSPKAIYLVEAEVPTPEGGVRKVKQPHVDPAKCVGCGSCEYCCPLKDEPGVRVTSIGESRSPDNQILLSHKG